MKRLLLLVSVLLTLKGLSLYVHKTYVIDGHLRLSWKESQAKCVASGMELLSIESQEEAEMLKRLIEPSSQCVDGQVMAEMDFWTSGQRREDGSWWWASGSKAVTYTDWAPGAPSDYGGAERCLRLWGHHHLQWDDFLCTSRLHYICQKNLLPDIKGAAAKAVTTTMATTVKTKPTATKRKTKPKVVLVPVPVPMSRPEDDEMDDLLKDDEDDLDGDDDLLTSTTKEKEMLQMPAMNLSGVAEVVVRLATTPEARVFVGGGVKEVVRVVERAESYSLPVHVLSFVAFQTEKQRWLEAKEFCLRLGMDMAAVADDNERCRLSAFLREKKLDQSCFWLREWDPMINSPHPVHEDFHRKGVPLTEEVRKEDELLRLKSVHLRQAKHRKCLLLIPSKDAIVCRECWIRCRIVCEKSSHFPS